MKRLCLIGLGNPGPKYIGTRHNIGFDWIDTLVEQLDLDYSEFTDKFEGAWMEAKWKDLEIHFLKPMTYMNESGKAALKWRQKFQDDESKILVVYDDVDLALGKLRLRFEGTDGGHRGLRSILERLGQNQIPRLRLGVGRSGEGKQTVEHVLEKFARDEEDCVGRILAGAKNQFETIAQEFERPEIAMNKINGLNYAS